MQNEPVKWKYIGKIKTSDLIKKEKEMIGLLIDKSNIDTKFRQANIGYVFSFNYDCNGILGKFGKRKDEPNGFLNKSANIPSGYISSVDIFPTRNGHILSIDDEMGGAFSVQVDLIKTKQTINILSGFRNAFFTDNFPFNAIGLIDEICVLFQNPDTKTIEMTQPGYQEIYDNSYIKSRF